MQIPALDAVESKRVGILQGDSFNLVAIMHDMSVPERNNGKFFRTARPICVQTTGPVCFEKIFNTANKIEQRNLSQAFWQEADKTYRAVSENHQLEDGEEFDFERLHKTEQGMFEAHFLNNIHHILSNVGVSHEVWHNFLEEARHNRVEDAEMADIEYSLYSDNQSFEESDFSEQLYFPNDKTVKNWGLYNYNHTEDDFDMYSLWYRFRTGGDSITEIPLIDYTGGQASIISSNPDFGDITDNHISSELAKSLESGTVSDDLSRLETKLVEAIQQIDIPKKTQELISNATESNRVKASAVAENI